MSRQQIGWALLGFLIFAEVWSGLMLLVNAIHREWGYAAFFALMAAINGGNANHLHRTLKRG